MAQSLMMTEQGYQEMKRELDELKTVKRQEISEKIRVARGFGDLSENSEYDEAKNEQALVEARILQLEEQLKNAKIISAENLSSEVVSVGTTVKMLDMEYNEELTYRIVSAVESNSDMNTITDESPVGKALIGHQAGEVVDVTVPSGAVIKFKILEISL